MSKKPQSNSSTAGTPRVKVLYQNLNGTWYAFAENGGELYFGKVPVKHSKKNAKVKKATRSQVADKAA